MSIRIEVNNLTKSYKQHVVIDNLNLVVDEGEIVVFQGPSGIGKSTFLRCLTKLEHFEKGTINVGSLTLHPGTNFHKEKETINLVRQRLGFVFQFFNLFPHLSVLDNLTISPIKVLKTPREQAEKEAYELLDKVGLKDKAHTFPNSLSGGQKQRISIVRALAMHPKAILFDEPTASLDPETKKEIAGVIESFEEGLTMLIVTHEPTFVEKIASRIVKFGPGCRILSDTKTIR